MGSDHLDAFIENSEFYLERYIPKLLRRALDWNGIQRMTTAFRQRGVCHLLWTGNRNHFFANMVQSAGAFLHFLKFCHEEQKVLSHCKPFYDALAAGCWEAAVQIARHSRMTWAEGYEYKEDFFFVQFLMAYFFLDAGEENSRKILEDFDAARAGAEEERFAICNALIDGDRPLFEETLGLLLEQRAEKIEGMIQRGALPEEIWAWMRYFSSEGLALVRLAERNGLAVNDTFLHIPDSVRKAPAIVFNGDAWQNLQYSL
ncbi:MAG: hypothetical protein M0036_01365 [Desulfobacteraceae bacterium]|nr:hypothetical protein [Desulfobacteraceae bacterium]